MKHRNNKSIVFATFFLAVSFVSAAEPVVEPLKASASDILKFLGAHAYKWTYLPSTPYKEIGVTLFQSTRRPSGDFDRKYIGRNMCSFTDAHTSDEMLIVCGNKDDGRATVLVQYALATATYKLENLPSSRSCSGTGDGGVPPFIGSEYILMAQWKDNKVTGKMDGMLSYVSIVIETK